MSEWSQQPNKGGAVLDPTLIPIRKTNKGSIVHHSEVSAALRVGSPPRQHANTGGERGEGGGLTLCKAQTQLCSSGVMQPAAPG